MVLVMVLVIGFSLCTYGASARATTVKNYRINSCKIKYTSSTGQVMGYWSEPQKQTDKEVTLYCDGIVVSTYTVSGTSCDLTKDVVDHGTGRYYIEVYPTRLGEDYAKVSSTINITETKYTKCKSFDSSLYEFTGSNWKYDAATGRVEAEWYKGEKNSGAKIALYKGGSFIDKWRTVNGRIHDYTSVIAKKGTGTYTFRVYPSLIGDNYTIESEELYVDNDDLKIIKELATAEEKAEEAARVGWYQAEGSSVWKYYKSPGEMAKNEWLTIEGKTYYFSSSGAMQIGWQAINDKWYYFGSNGVLARNITTAGGQKINGNGEWVDDNGVPVSAKGQKQAPATPVSLSKCNISINEKGSEPGVVKTATFNGGTGFTISDVTYSVPQENWKAGEGVKVTMLATIKANYSFEKDVVFTARNCTGVTSKGDQAQRTVSFTYYPKKQLLTPSFFYIQNDDNQLRWRPVEGASTYKITAYQDGTQTYSVTSEEPHVELSEILTDDPATMSIKITANAGKTKSKYLLASSAADITDVNKMLSECAVDGTFKWSNNRVKYIDSDGENAKGWLKLAGRWMHFGKNGYADGPGWYKDTDGLWYYFDKDFTMCTGMINDGKADYFMNDGSIKDLPLGAYKE